MNIHTKLSILYVVLFKLSYMRIKNNARNLGMDDYLKNGILLLFGVFVCGMEYLFFNRFWEILSTIQMGFILVLPKLISFAGSFLYAFLAYSSIMTTLTALYRSGDMKVFLVSPAPMWIPLLYKWIEIAFRSGITFLVLSIPPVIALYQWLDLGIAFFVVYCISISTLASIAVCVGMISGMILMSLFPEKRLHQSVAIVGLCLAAIMIGGLRFLNIEGLWSEIPEQSELINYFLAQEEPGWLRYSPATLLSHTMIPFLWGTNGGWFWTGINILLSVIVLSITLGLGTFLFPIGWKKSQEQADPHIYRLQQNPFLISSLFLPKRFLILMKKDWIIMWRDPNIWTQLFMMIPLALMYILNLSLLPLDVEGLALILAISNVGLIGMITAAVSARFLYPTVSREGRSMWIAVQAPISSFHYVLQKIAFACPPVLAVSITLLFASMLLLDLNTSFILWSLLYGISLVLMLCVLAVSMGCCFPVFDYQHLMEVSLGKGALLFMFLALLMVGTLMYAAYKSVFPSGTIQLLDTPFIMWLGFWLCITSITVWIGKRNINRLEVK